MDRSAGLQQVLERVAASLRVLGHPDRLRLIDAMLQDRMSVAELAEQVDLAPNAVSQHLQMMLAQGLLRRRREGRCVYYEVVDSLAKTLLACLWKAAETGELGRVRK